VYLIRKHASQKTWLRFVARTLVGVPRRLVYYLRRRKFALARAYAAGIADGVASRMGERGWLA
jgi:hypothetical protein